MTAGVAHASNGGFTPVTPNSPNASHTTTTYWVVMGFTAMIFLIVESAIIVFAIKYRQRGRPRSEDGLQVHGHTRLELTWTVIPVMILAAIAIVVWVELPKISSAPAAADPIHITVQGHQFYWLFEYPNGARSIDDLYVPVDEIVDLKIESADVIHSWWVPALGGKVMAIPGRTNHTWFKAERTGEYNGQCAELCGLYHASMLAHVHVESEAQYRTNIAAAVMPGVLGKAEFQGVCAKCHGMAGQGGYGPDISNNPLLTQKAGLVSILQHGFILMPAVGNTWTQAQLDALVGYVKTHIFKGAASGG